jgi:Ni/Co efflux regulator RcnB
MGAGERHFGAATPEARSFGHAGTERVAGGEVRRSLTGRVYQYHGRTYHPFHVARYAWPAGYRYRRYEIGYRLPIIFLVDQYYITDYAAYQIEPPPPGLQWVRYGPDLLLVDPTTGQVQDVVHSAFEEGDDVPQGEFVADAPADPGTGQ